MRVWISRDGVQTWQIIVGTHATIGRLASCEIVLDGPDVAPVHASLSDPATLEPYGPVFVDGVRINGSMRVTPAHEIRIGTAILAVYPSAVVETVETDEPTALVPMPANPPALMPAPSVYREVLAGNPEEHAFLAALRSKPTDDCRAIYADWLEDRGDALRASLVRGAALTKLGARTTDPAWRAIASGLPIKCSAQHCPKTWSALAAKPGEERLRHCMRCKRDVRFCVSRDDVRIAKAWNQPIVRDEPE